MTPSLGVTSDYLDDLADIHAEAVKNIGRAKQYTAGIGESCWWNHGLICHSNNAAFDKAEEFRNKAAEALAALGNRLAEGLTVASDAYSDTDTNAGDEIGDAGAQI